jgi:hypothetical protein
MIAPRISANPSFCAILPREAEDKFKDFNHPDAVIGTGPFVLKILRERRPCRLHVARQVAAAGNPACPTLGDSATLWHMLGMR